jgi:hypothetical protein
LYFDAILRLKVNPWKSELVAAGQVPHQEELADILNFSISSLPLKYLRLSLGASCKSNAIWSGVVQKMERRLASWKMIYLARGGRLTLTKNMLPNSPMYFLSVFQYN